MPALFLFARYEWSKIHSNDTNEKYPFNSKIGIAVWEIESGPIAQLARAHALQA